MALSDNLKKIREEYKLTKKELCEKTGISERAYLTYEFGEREPKVSVIEKLADFYNVSTDYLLGRTPVKQTATEIPDPFANIDVSALEKRIIKQYTELDESTRALCIELFLKLNPALNAVFQEITQQTPEPPKPVEPPPKPDIQIQKMRNSEFAIARGGNGMYKPLPTDEQMESFEEVTPDMI